VVTTIGQCWWTDGKAENRLSCLEILSMQLWELKPHIKISRNLRRFIDLMRNDGSGSDPSPFPLQVEASGPRPRGNLILGCNDFV